MVGAPPTKRRRRAAAGGAVERAAPDAPGFLRRASVRPATAKRYTEAAEDFVSNMGVVHTPEEADPLLEAYFELLYRSNDSQEVARVSLYGLAWERGWPTKGATFPLAKQALKGWRRREPPGSRKPLPWETALCFADDQLQQGTPVGREAAC